MLIISEAVYNGHLRHNDTAGACPGQQPTNNDGTSNDDDISGDNGSDGQGKENVCHNGKKLSISASSRQDHLGHGDINGSC